MTNTSASDDAVPEAGSEQRDPRHAMMLRCQLIDEHRRSYPCFLRNLSRHGVSGRGCAGLYVGQRLIIILPAIGPVEAVVRWADGDRFGLELDVTIDPDLVKLPGAPANQAKFNPMHIHQPVTDYRRPGLRGVP